MPYTKEQLRVYWQANKAILNQKRRQKRRLAKLGLVEQVSHNLSGEVSRVSQKLAKVSYKSPTANPETENLDLVSHSKPQNGKPNSEMANPILAQLIIEY